MIKTITYPLLIALLIASLPSAGDEIYQWTDENGKVHFGDKPPRGKDAKNITSSTSKINVDSSARERNKMADIFAPPTVEEQQYQQQKAAGQTRAQQAKKEYCDNLKKELSFFQTERFYWVDDKGNSSHATEEERQQMIGKLQQAIKANC